MRSEGELVSFEADAADGVVRVTDELESRDVTLGVDVDVTLEPASTDLFVFPVDDAVSLTTTHLRIDPDSKPFLRNGDGDHLGEFTSDPQRFERGTYFVELTDNTKTYVRIEDAAFTAAYESSDIDTAATTLEFGDETTVTVGARSYHSRPQTSLEVPDDPAAVAEAVSYLGSSVKEFTCERSWPTLRGHPPAIRPGDELDVPSWLSKPDTGVTIEVPDEYGAIYPVAPLAFYLGATLEIGDSATLHLDNGHSEPLETPTRSLAEGAESVLSRALFFDSLVRIGGYYAFPRREYDLVAGELPFYPPNLYGESVADQLLEYLEADVTVLDGLRPAWTCTATLRPDVEDVALLSPLANTLAPIRVASDDAPADSTTVADSSIPEVGEATTTDRVPPGVTRLVDEAFATQRDRSMPPPADTTLAFVLGDGGRADALRSSLATARQSRVRTATTVVTDSASTDALAEVLRSQPDFLYYEPPTDAVDVGPESALLDANPAGSWPSMVAFGRPLSASVQTTLVERGTIAGLIADTRLSPSAVGHLVSVLTAGHTLQWSATRADLDPAHRFFGSPTAVLTNRSRGVKPPLTDVESVSAEKHVAHRTVPATERNRLGSVGRVENESINDVYYLVGTSAPEAHTYTTSDVVDALESDSHVVHLNGRPYHEERDITPEFVRRSARDALEQRRD